ncbi:MAG: HEAT repeat domain-containing protein [Candidatus Micrarchaeia archaeon]
MSNSNKNTHPSEIRKFEKDYNSVKQAWTSGRTVPEEVEKRLQKAVLSLDSAEEAIEMLASISPTKSGTGRNPAIRQQHRILDPAQEFVANKADEMLRYLSVPNQPRRRVKRTARKKLPLFEAFNQLYPNGFFPDKEANTRIFAAYNAINLQASLSSHPKKRTEQIITLLKTGEIPEVLQTIPPSASLFSGRKALERIAGILEAASGNQESWAVSHLDSSLDLLPDYGKAKATAALLGATYTSDKISKSVSSLVWEKMGRFVSRSSSAFQAEVREQVRKLSSSSGPGRIKHLYNDFSEYLRSGVPAPKAERQTLPGEKGTERIPIDISAVLQGLESEAEFDTQSVDLSPAKAWPVPKLVDSALRLAEADIPPHNQEARNILCCKIIRPVAEDMVVLKKDGKRVLLVPEAGEESQVKLLELLVKVSQKSGVEKELKAYLASSEGDSEVHSRLSRLYPEEQVPETGEIAGEYEEAKESTAKIRTGPEEPIEDVPEDKGSSSGEEVKGGEGEKQFSLDIHQDTHEPAPLAEDGDKSPEGEQKESDSRPELQNEPGTTMEEEAPGLPPEFNSLKPALSILANPKHILEDREDAYQEIMSSFAGKPRKYEELVMGLSDIALNGKDEDAAMATGAMLTLVFQGGHIPSYLITANLAAVNPKVSNPVFYQHAVSGNEARLLSVSEILAHRREVSGQGRDERGRIKTRRERALDEVLSSFSGKEASRMILRFAVHDYEFPQTLLLQHLEQTDPEGRESLDVLLGKHTRPSSFSLKLAKSHLNNLGGLPDCSRSIALAALKVLKQDDLEFCITNFQNSSSAGNSLIWETILSNFPGRDVDSALRERFPEFSQETRISALEVLSKRKPSIENMAFILGETDSSELGQHATNALVSMEFSGSHPEAEFLLLYEMRTGRNEKLREFAGEVLPALIEKGEGVLSKDSALKLYSLSEVEQDNIISDAARSILLSGSEDVLAEMGAKKTKSLVSALASSDEQIRVLSQFALARRMQRSEEGFSEISSEVAKQSLDWTGKTAAMARKASLFSAFMAGTEQAVSRMLVPALGHDSENISSYACTLLSNMGEKGIAAAEAAAKGENLLGDFTPLQKRRFGLRALEVLADAGAYRRMISLLSCDSETLREDTYKVLDSLPHSPEKKQSLIEALSSKEERIRLSALELLREEHIPRKILSGLAADISNMVSSKAARIIASDMVAEELIDFLSSDSNNEYSRQKVADAALRLTPSLPRSLAKQGPSSIAALGYFPTNKSLQELYKLHKEAVGSTEDVDGAVSRICNLVAERCVEGREDKAELILQAYYLFNTPETRQACASAAKGPVADNLRQAALHSRSPHLLFSATELFLATSNVEYAADTAIALREIEEMPPLPLKLPHQKILFGEKGKMESLPLPYEDPGAKEAPYKLVKEVAFRELLNSGGNRNASNLLFDFLSHFDDGAGMFSRNLRASYEMLWMHRNHPNLEKLASKLYIQADDDFQEQVSLLSRIVLENDFSVLNKILDYEELPLLVAEHAFRSAAEAISEIDSIPEAESAEKFSLLAQILAQDPEPPKTSAVVSHLKSVAEPIVGPLSDQSISRGLNFLQKHRARVSPVSDEVSPEEARRDAGKLSRNGPKVRSPHMAPPPKRRR